MVAKVLLHGFAKVVNLDSNFEQILPLLIGVHHLCSLYWKETTQLSLLLPRHTKIFFCVIIYNMYAGCLL